MWFERHGSTPVTEVSAGWPAPYRDLVPDEGVPYLAALRNTDSGLRMRLLWERTCRK